MPEDALQLRKDGTVRIQIGEQSYRLRRPTVGEMWRLEEAWDEDVVAVSRADGVTARALGQAVIGWLQGLIRTLCEVEPFEFSEDLPPWLVGVALGPRLFAHWQSSPLGSGV